MKRREGRKTTRNVIQTSIATLTGSALVATSLLAGTAASAAGVPMFPGKTDQVSFEPGRYIVTLVDEAVATYEGGVDGYSATRPDEGDQLNARRAPAQDYSEYLEEKQEDVAASVGAEIDASYTMALNGFSANLSPEQAAELVANKEVATLTPDELHHLTAVPSTEFLGLSGEGGVWEQVGGVDQAGAGVVVGVLDTGIAPENPSFAGETLGTAAGDEPYLSGDNVISFAKNDGQTFTGTCQTGEQFTVDDCNTKVITARYYVAGFGAGNIADASLGEYLSPRDGDGHGSHTASTAAGNADVPASIGGIDFGSISGVAPAAKIAAYKVCWTGQDPEVTTDDGCATTDLLNGIDQAVIDGVDVMNFSIGGGPADSTFSPTDAAFLGAASAGIFVSASAGNAGPDASTLDNAAPWITTVAASTIPSYEATVTLGNGEAYAGASITVSMDPDAEPVSGSFVAAATVANEGVADPTLCGPNSLNPELVEEDTIILCERGVYDRVAKSAEVARVGGIGMVMVNVTPGSIDTDFHSVPTVHLSHVYYEELSAYAATPGATATFTTGNELGTTPPAPQVAGFSSRGPILVDGQDILKPDISAPGVSILAAGPNAETADPSYQFLSGTSMAAPHIAGIAALYFGERPNATPAEVKSAMMTTAYNTVDGAGDDVTDPFVQGAGHVDPTSFFEPGLLYLNGQPEWYAYLQALGYNAGVEPVDPSNLNLASIAIGSLTAPETITRTVTSTQAGTFEASVSGLAGIDAVVEPSTLTFGGAGESQSFTVTFSRTDAALDEFATGALTWTSGDITVRSPIAVQPVTIVAPDEVEGTGVSGSVDITVTPGGDGGIPLSTTGLSRGELLPDPDGEEAEHSGSGVTGDFNEYSVTVGEGVQFVRFDLDAVDDTSDLDLTVYLLDAEGTPIAGWQSATGSADERVDLEAPEAGEYLVYVDVFSANPATAWDFVVTSVVPGGSPLAFDPPVISGVQGEHATFTASWADLEPESTYIGLVNYGETGASTVLTVETGEAVEPGTPVNVSPPTISGKAEVGKTLKANPGDWDVDGLSFAYQWQADGVDIPGADKKRYRVQPSDAGTTIAVVVTATKGDLPPGTAASEGVVVKDKSTTRLSLDRQILFSWQRVTATITVDTVGDTEPVGTIVLAVDGREFEVALPAGSHGVVDYELPRLGSGFYQVRATFEGSETVGGSKSSPNWFWVIF